MTVDEIRARMQRIKDTAAKDDDESAHSQEDCLHREVLRAIADGAPNAAELAYEALQTRRIRFHRWCA